MNKTDTITKLRRIIQNFIKCVGRDCPDVHPTSDLNRDVGLSSDEGVCIVLEICSEFEIEIPDDFNAIVHEDGNRARTLNELAECVMSFGGSK